MATKTMRKIVKIDEDKCNGCGLCVPSCAEGALQIIDGKARLVAEIYCDGLGACLGECPQDAITIEEREAAEYDEVATEEHLTEQHQRHHEHHEFHQPITGENNLACGCPGSAMQQFESPAEDVAATHQPSRLTQWPIQLTLVPPTAPFLAGADILLTGDCVAYASGGFHQDFLKDHALLVACPKLDDWNAHLAKLTQVLQQSAPKSVTVMRMEVPCCGGLTQMAQQAVQDSGLRVPLAEVVIGIRGDIKTVNPL
jgi:Pyruvate/2-oxoacid:ferredoxin oxidoreductase delta subunit